MTMTHLPTLGPSCPSLVDGVVHEGRAAHPWWRGAGCWCGGPPRALLKNTCFGNPGPRRFQRPIRRVQSVFELERSNRSTSLISKRRDTATPSARLAPRTAVPKTASQSMMNTSRAVALLPERRQVAEVGTVSAVSESGMARESCGLLNTHITPKAVAAPVARITAEPHPTRDLPRAYMRAREKLATRVNEVASARARTAARSN